MLAKNKAWLADLLESKNASLSIKSASPYVHVTGNMICGFNNGNNAPSNRSGDGSVSSYYSCLSDTDSTDSACLSATPASTDTSAPPPSSSFWACFAPTTATCYVTIDCDKKKSAVLDTGASVDITSKRHRTGQLTDSRNNPK